MVSRAPFDVFGPIDRVYDVAVAASQKARTQASLHAFQYVEIYLNDPPRQA